MKKHKWSAIGIGTKNQKEEWLEVFYPKELLNLDSKVVQEKNSAQTLL